MYSLWLLLLYLASLLCLFDVTWLISLASCSEIYGGPVLCLTLRSKIYQVPAITRETEANTKMRSLKLDAKTAGQFNSDNYDSGGNKSNMDPHMDPFNRDNVYSKKILGSDFSGHPKPTLKTLRSKKTSSSSTAQNEDIKNITKKLKLPATIGSRPILSIKLLGYKELI